MDFVIWACRVVHILSAVVLLGGMVYYNAVLRPVAEYEKVFAQQWMVVVDQRFQGFIWSTVWPLLVTGVILLLMQPGLANVSVFDPWTLLIFVKGLSFGLLVFFAWQMGVVVRRMGETIGNEEEAFDDWKRTYAILMKRSIAAGMAAIVASGALRVV